MVVTIVLRNPFESVHSVLKEAVQSLWWIAVVISLIASDNSSRDGKIIPCRQCVTYARSEKSDDARLGEYGGCAGRRKAF
jgi:hypothetical protein